MEVSQQQIVRIGSLAKTLTTFENAAESILSSGILKSPGEIEAFKMGFHAALELVRREYGIK